MDLTDSHLWHVPDHLRARYSWLEVRNAAAVLSASNPQGFADILTVLDAFELEASDLTTPGGNRGSIAIRLDGAFADLGWVPVRINTEFTLTGVVKAGRFHGQQVIESSVSSVGFEVDNFNGRVAVDVEWRAKDGNLDRDFSAYRALYDAGIIDGAVIITRDHYGILDLCREDLGDMDAHKRLSTTTTTNTRAARPRLTRGDAGGCPVLVVGIGRETWNGR